MSIARSYSAQLNGLGAEPITIEVDISNGLHSFSIVGLGDRSIEEARDRISAALKNSGFVSPKQKNQKVIISLAPADIRKEGPSFDLGMTLTYLLSSNQIKYNPEKILFLGELSLEGKLRRVVGILPILCQAKEMGFDRAFIPYENYEEASLARDIAVYPANSLQQITEHLGGIEQIRPIEPRTDLDYQETNDGPDLASVKGNETAKRGLEIAAAGAHNLVLYGPPGTGKSLLAKCFPSILPNLSYEESVEVTSIHSISQNLDHSFITRPPFRSPHHTASYPSIVGGGTFPKPGEVTLAHRGVLFLDEFAEFDRSVIEALRQPLEDREITISRAKGVVTFPAQCILIASMNPCPCGMGKEKGCACTSKMLKSYESKMSGPIADRVDIWLNIDKVDYKKLGDPNLIGTNSESIKNRVEQSRMIQLERFRRYGINKKFNSEMSGGDTEKLIRIEPEARRVLITSAEKLGMSGRAFHRTLKVAQTIADLSQGDIVTVENILEAIQYRDRRRI
jgi:magnesium chelatase family protein